jgi:hypothetical protein
VHHSKLVIGAAGAVIAAMSFAAGLQAQLVDPGVGIDPITVNRTLKGGRLLLVPQPSGENPASRPALPNGCEPRSSSARKAHSNEVPGRCLAEAPALSRRPAAIV